MKFETSIIEKLEKDIGFYEDQCKRGRVLSDDVFPVLQRIEKTMEKIGLEYCAENLIKLGSKKYKKYEKTLDCSKWIMSTNK
jgi:hypothetical protein